MENTTINFTNIYQRPQVIPDTVTVTYKSLITLPEIVAYFIIYLTVHILLGLWKQKIEKKVVKTEDDVTRLKFLIQAFKWWPFVFVLFIVISNI